MVTRSVLDKTSGLKWLRSISERSTSYNIYQHQGCLALANKTTGGKMYLLKTTSKCTLLINFYHPKHMTERKFDTVTEALRKRISEKLKEIDISSQTAIIISDSKICYFLCQKRINQEPLEWKCVWWCKSGVQIKHPVLAKEK